MVNGPNRYAYVGGDPLQGVDPRGEQVAPTAEWIGGRVGLAGLWAAADGPVLPFGDVVAAGILVYSAGQLLHDYYFPPSAPILNESCPGNDPGSWERIPNHSGHPAYWDKNQKKKGPVFEPDRGGDRAHGGGRQWKKWNKYGDWKRGRPRDGGTYNDDGVRIR